MIFNEIHSAYYNAVARIIAAVQDKTTDERRLREIVEACAFGESALTVLPSLKSGKWQLLHADGTTPIEHTPTMPLTDVQKQWLKAVSLDPRIRLFDVDLSWLGDVSPLFTAEDVFVYDKYGDGDPFEDEGYVRRFRTILQALREGKTLKIEMRSRTGRVTYARCRPERLEYSEKDDKFRLVTSGCAFIRSVNLARITKCKLVEEAVLDETPPSVTHDSVTLRVSTERNTLERCLLHFAHFEKRAQREEDHYLLHVTYDRDDETELVIRVLSFGPLVEVVAPDTFRERIIERLKKQKSCGL